MPAGPKETALASLLQRYGDDAVTMDAALSGARGSEPALLEKLLQPDARRRRAAHEAAIVDGERDDHSRRAGCVGADRRWRRSPMRIVRRGSARRCCEAPKSRWSRTRRCRAARGAAPRLRLRRQPWLPLARHVRPARAGAPAREAPTRSKTRAVRRLVPDARSRGARAGGAGGRARRRPRRRAAAPARPRTGGVLGARRRDSGDLATRAANVLARIDWPGKPGRREPVTPLTAAEQQRFEAGREVYRNICQACHQPDGRGLARVAPPLVGSVLALAPADVTSRILLNGKEGSVGLMPPIGSTLTDDQIAGVLTYVRREWGQAGDPVDPATVADRARADGRPHQAVDRRRAAGDDPGRPRRTLIRTTSARPEGRAYGRPTEGLRRPASHRRPDLQVGAPGLGRECLSENGPHMTRRNQPEYVVARLFSLRSVAGTSTAGSPVASNSRPRYPL